MGRRHAPGGDAVGAGPGGVVRADGVRRISNYSGWQTAQAATWQRAVPGRAPLASTQVEYSLLNRRIEAEVLPAAQALGLGILPWSPLGRGVLTGKYRTGTPSDSRGASPHFAELRGRLPRRPQSPRVVEAVARAADGLGWSPLEVALAWVRDRPGVMAPIVGARTAAQLRAPRWRSRSLTCHPRSSRPSTTCRRPGGDEAPARPCAGRQPGGSSDEFDRLTIPRDFSRNCVTRLLVDRAEYGGWELDRVRLGPDGTRRVSCAARSSASCGPTPTRLVPRV